MSALLLSNGFEQLRLQPAQTGLDVGHRWSPSAQNFSTKKAPSTIEQILNDAGLRMRTATEQDKPAILEFCREHFFHDEPLNVSIKLLTSGNGSKCQELEDFCMAPSGDNMVICESKDSSFKGLASVMILGVATRKEAENSAKELAALPPLDPLPDSATPCERFERIARLLDTAANDAGLFEQYPDVDEMFDVKIISVHPKFRGRKVAVALLDKARDLAKERGIKLIRTICSSHFTALAVAKLGHECVYRMEYSEFRDSEGKAIFTPEPPHTALTIYILRVAD